MVRPQNQELQMTDIMFEASFDNDSAFSIETAFNPFKAESHQSRGNARTACKGNNCISQEHGPFYDHYRKNNDDGLHRPSGGVSVFEYPLSTQQLQRSAQQEKSKEIFVSPYRLEKDTDEEEPKLSPHSIPSFPIPKPPLAARERSPSPAARSTKQVVSKLPTHISDSLSLSAPPRRSSSLLSEAACYTPISTSSKKLSSANSSKAFDSALRLAMNGVESMDMCPIVDPFEKESLQGEALKIVRDLDPRNTSMERARSFRGKEVFHNLPSKVNLVGSVIPNPRARRDLGSRPPSSRSSPPPYIPLPPFLSPDDQKNLSSAATKTLNRGRGVSPRSRKQLCQSPVSLTREGRPKAPMREGLMLSPTKSHQMVMSCSSRIRSQSPRLSKSATDRDCFGILPNSARDSKKVLCNDKPPATPKRKSKSLKDESIFGSVKPPCTPKRKSKSLKDDNVFSVVWQRSPGNSLHEKVEKESERTRSSIEPPVAVHQRRLVGGASRRVRVDEKQPSRTSKDHASNTASYCRQKRGRILDPANQAIRPGDHTMGRSSSVTRTMKKPERSQEFYFIPEPTSPNRFDATPCHLDVPPMSPFRKGTVADIPPMSPIRKRSLQKMNSIRSYHHPVPPAIDEARPPRQSRRRSCY